MEPTTKKAGKRKTKMRVMRAVPRCRPRNEAKHRLELLFYCSGDVEAVDTHQQRAVPVFVSELKDHRLVPGETALLECVVAGGPPPEIVWTRRGHPLLDKTRYRPTRPPILSGAGFTRPTRPPTVSGVEVTKLTQFGRWRLQCGHLLPVL